MVILPYGMGTSGIAATRGFEDFAHVLTAGLGNNPSRTELIKHNKPDVIFGSPSSVARLARQVELDGLDPHETSVRRILTVSEPMSRERQKFIAGRWDADVYNNYASTEGDLMASECRFHDGLHQVKEDYLWMSAVDLESKEMLEHGKPGADVITTLIEPGMSCGMVLINYHHGDKFAVLDGGCPCERTSLKVTPPIRIGDNELEVGYIRIGLDDLEAMVFRPEFNDYLTGEYEVLKGYDTEEELHKIKVRVETRRPPPDNFVKKLNDSVHRHFTLNIVATGESKVADILMEAVPEGGLEISSMPGKPKRIINKESRFWL
jgi:phenylacetate-CoA ligase